MNFLEILAQLSLIEKSPKSALVFINSVGACDFGVYPCLNKAIFEAGRKFFYEMYKAEILGNERASRYMHSCVIEKTC